MKKIAILGSNGYIGRFLADNLSMEYEVHLVNRSIVDLLNFKSVYEYFTKHYFDVVINCAGNLNSQMDCFDEKIYYSNITIFNNLIASKGLYGKLIIFGSGAEFDRRFDILNQGEFNISLCFPEDHYGKSKNLISRICYNICEVYVFRLFGVFHKTEPEYRLLKKVMFSESITIQDRYFDYFYLEDILPIIDYYINNVNTYLYKDINVVYSEKLKLSEFINRFLEIHNLKREIIITENPLNYTGNGKLLKNLNLSIKGLNYGLEHYI